MYIHATCKKDPQAGDQILYFGIHLLTNKLYLAHPVALFNKWINFPGDSFCGPPMLDTLTLISARKGSSLSLSHVAYHTDKSRWDFDMINNLRDYLKQ